MPAAAREQVACSPPARGRHRPPTAISSVSPGGAGAWSSGTEAREFVPKEESDKAPGGVRRLRQSVEAALARAPVETAPLGHNFTSHGRRLSVSGGRYRGKRNRRRDVLAGRSSASFVPERAVGHARSSEPVIEHEKAGLRFNLFGGLSRGDRCVAPSRGHPVAVLACGGG